jgi:hypothetical protein
VPPAPPPPSQFPSTEGGAAAHAVQQAPEQAFRVRSPATGGRPLSTAQSIGVAALTAAAVVGMGVFIAERGSRAVAPPPPGPAVVVIPVPASAERPAAAPAKASAAEAPPKATGVSPGDLPGGHGYITVRSPVNANVYVNGKSAGVTNEQLVALCGKWFVRLGTPTASGHPFWVAPGQTVVIPCQGKVEIEAKPAPSPPAKAPRGNLPR